MQLNFIVWQMKQEDKLKGEKQYENKTNYLRSSIIRCCRNSGCFLSPTTKRYVQGC
ncbi:hypothetical protein PT2222_180105 [Paraburkholderia tropica]